MATIPANLLYTKEHEWIKINDDGTVTIGITDYAQNALGDIVFVELPEVGDFLEKERSFGVVESIKSVSDLYSPLSGEVIENNNKIIDDPELINQSPYNEGHMIKVKLSNRNDLDGLINASAYEEFCANLDD